MFRGRKRVMCLECAESFHDGFPAATKLVKCGHRYCNLCIRFHKMNPEMPCIRCHPDGENTYIKSKMKFNEQRMAFLRGSSTSVSDLRDGVAAQDASKSSRASLYSKCGAATSYASVLASGASGSRLADASGAPAAASRTSAPVSRSEVATSGVPAPSSHSRMTASRTVPAPPSRPGMAASRTSASVSCSGKTTSLRIPAAPPTTTSSGAAASRTSASALHSGAAASRTSASALHSGAAASRTSASALHSGAAASRTSASALHSGVAASRTSASAARSGVAASSATTPASRAPPPASRSASGTADVSRKRSVRFSSPIVAAATVCRIMFRSGKVPTRPSIKSTRARTSGSGTGVPSNHAVSEPSSASSEVHRHADVCEQSQIGLSSSEATPHPLGHQDIVAEELSLESFNREEQLKLCDEFYKRKTINGVPTKVAPPWMEKLMKEHPPKLAYENGKAVLSYWAEEWVPNRYYSTSSERTPWYASKVTTSCTVGPRLWGHQSP